MSPDCSALTASHLPLRQTEGFLTSVLKLIGLSLAVPDHTTLSRRASKPRAPNKRPGDRIPEKGPVHVLIDSTGLQVYGAGQWLEEKHGVKSRRGWRKLHLALDADSGDIIAHVITDQDAGDASQVEPLLDQIDSPIGQLTADGAYDGEPTYDAVTRHSADVAVVIPPRANAVERRHGDPTNQRNQHIATIDADLTADPLITGRGGPLHGERLDRLLSVLAIAGQGAVAILIRDHIRLAEHGLYFFVALDEAFQLSDQ